MRTTGTVQAGEDDGITSVPVVASRARRGLSAAQQVGLTCAAMLGVTAAAYFVTPDRADSILASPWWVPIGLTVLFALFEYLVFVVQFRREGIVFSLSELGVALSLIYLTPGEAIIARLIGSGVVIFVIRNNRGVKLVFNTLLFTLEMACVFVVFRLLESAFGDSNAALVTSLVIAQLIIVPLMGVLTAFVISRYEGDFRRRVLAGVASSWWFYAITTVLSAMTIALALHSAWLIVLALLPTGALWFVMRTHGELMQQLRDLEASHGFAGQVGRSLELDEITSSALEAAHRLMHADGVALVRFVDGDVSDRHTHGDLPVELPDTADESGWADLIERGAATLLTPAEVKARGLTVVGDVPSLIVAPVDDGEGSIALLVMAAWHNQVLRWNERSRAQAQSLAEQLSPNLRKGVLHERLEWEARHDALTGLPGRTLFERYVAEALTAKPSGVWSVMMLDLDRFKEVNDTLGHHAGDALLAEFADRMRSIIRPEDRLARLAGDEFAILCQRDSSDEIADLARRAFDQGGRPVVLDGLEIVVTVSVGVAELEVTDKQPMHPMRRADIAMYNAKWQRTGVETYRFEIDRRTPARLSMLGDLRTAIETNQLHVVYQPKLHLDSRAVVGVEALVRWEHPTRGWVPPSEFVRVAEDTGLIKQLTDFVLGRGIEAIAAVRAQGHSLGLAVNVSAHDLFDARLADRVNDHLERHSVDPSWLTLEITESSLFIDAPRTRATIAALHEVGLTMAVDDFGTGYSSLSYLRRLPVRELKIDQTFVAGLLTDKQDEAIVRSTVDLGHNLGLSVVAEGVETSAVLERLAVIGCDVAQGYAISRPVSIEDVAGALQGDIAWAATGG